MTKVFYTFWLPAPFGKPLARRALALGLCAALLGPGLTGCGRRTDASSPHPAAPAQESASGVRIIIGLDTSTGFEPHLGEGADLAARLDGRLEPDTDQLTLVRLDRTANEFYDDAPPESGDALRDLLVATLRTRPHRPGTRPAAFWSLAASRAARDPRATVLLCVTDADQDFAGVSEEAALRAAGAALAADTNVRTVILCGASPENWAGWRARFAALDASHRLRFVPLDGLAFDRINDLLSAARRVPGGRTTDAPLSQGDSL